MRELRFEANPSALAASLAVGSLGAPRPIAGRFGIRFSIVRSKRCSVYIAHARNTHGLKQRGHRGNVLLIATAPKARGDDTVE